MLKNKGPRATHVVRVGPIGWTFAAGLALVAVAAAGGVVETRGHPAWIVVAFGFVGWALVRAAVGGVWIRDDAVLVVRDWLRTRRYRADSALTISYLPYDGFVHFYLDSRLWATLAFAHEDAAPRPCRIAVTGFGKTKRQVHELQRTVARQGDCSG